MFLRYPRNLLLAFLALLPLLGVHSPAAADDRVIIREYHNRTYHTKGLLKRTVLKDGAGRLYTETQQEYTLATVDVEGADSSDDRAATRFPQLTRTEQLWYEGQGSAGKRTYTTHRYDEYGNVIEFFDAGDVGALDDVHATIAYSRDTAAYIVGKPTQITVQGGGRLMRRREATYAPGTGNLLQVREYLENGQAAVTDLGYNADGTLASVTGPANQRGQRYRLDYGYDPVLSTHIARITDSFGLSSTIAYDYKHGAPLSSVDSNGSITEQAYDQFGRLTSYSGPYQAGSGQATIRFEYHPEAQVPWARTRHLDVFRNPADPIDTVLFTDGTKRVLQTKKDISLYTGPTGAPVDAMSVSGRVVYDAFGRAIAQSYPVSESVGSPGTINRAVDPIAPTRTEYDVLDRTVRTILPDNTVTTMAYGFGTDRDGQLQFQTVVTDANGKRKVSYRDAQGLITAVQEFNRGQSIWTSYAYDALKQITQVRDDRGNLTRAEYDNLGRRTVLDNPDTGRTEHRFDLAGNLVEKITANLRAQGKAIRYGYDYGRLATISYPNNPENNVSYRYGAPGEAYGRAGRIAEVTSQAGREERYYGRLGEVVKEVRTVSSDRGAPQQAWATEYLFDTFGRLQRLVYPDGEVLSYGYDAGGNLAFAQGQKGGTSTTYLARLEYDQFEQRRYIAYGNGSHSEYRYDPRNRRLANLRAEVQGRAFQDLGYSYDNVGNILGLQNRVPVPGANSYGGPTNQVFQYDDLYRLVQAQGSYDFAPNKRDRYSLAMAYDSIHNITGKTQVHDVVTAGGQAIGQKKTSYAWAYAYGGVQPHAPTHLGERTYRYDANGNQLGWDHDKNGTRRNIVWDEENRIQSIFDNGQQQAYKYDDAGDRVVKRGPQGETVYVNQWFTVRNREVASKHVYAGSSRIATLLVPGVKPAEGGTGTIAGSGLPTGALQAPGILQGQGLAKRSAQAAAHSRNLEKNPHYASGGSAPPSNEHFLYYYHPDHLGSSSYITDGYGKIYQHLEYFPFGETWVDESSNTQRTPYLFTGKELDEETGLSYFGARYYDPRTSAWQSPDPILDQYLPSKSKKLPGMGGVFNSPNLSTFVYAHNNPIRFFDPNGKETVGELIDRKAMAAAGRDDGVATYGYAFAATAWNYFGFENLSKTSDSITGGRKDFKMADAGWAAFEVGTLGKGGGVVAAGKAVFKKFAGRTVSLFRAVSPEEFKMVSNTGKFDFGPNGSEMKQFGFSLDDTLKYADNFSDYAAILRVEVPKSALKLFDVSKGQIDPSIFKDGVMTINGQTALDRFNAVIKEINHEL